jgi:hypothetical protein
MIRAGLRYGNLGNCQGPPTFGDPQITDFIFAVLFCSLTSKKFACGAKIHSKIFGCGADIIKNFECHAKILKKLLVAPILIFFCVRHQCSCGDNTSFLLIIDF